MYSLVGHLKIHLRLENTCNHTVNVDLYVQGSLKYHPCEDMAL